MRRKGKRVDDPEEWLVLTMPSELQALVESLRPAGEREHYLDKALRGVMPRVEAAMVRMGAAESADAHTLVAENDDAVHDPPSVDEGSAMELERSGEATRCEQEEIKEKIENDAARTERTERTLLEVKRGAVQTRSQGGFEGDGAGTG